MIKIYLRVLELANGNTGRQTSRSVPKKSKTLRVLIVKCAFVRIVSPAFLPVGLVQDRYQPDQLVWMMDARWSGYVSPSGGSHRVIQASMLDWKVQKFKSLGCQNNN